MQWPVEITVTAMGAVEVEAATEAEARDIARERGLGLSEISTIYDVTAVRVDRTQALDRGYRLGQ